MKTAVISPYSSKLRSGKPNAKNYPYWKDLVGLLKEKGFYVIQIGVEGEEKIEGTNDFKKNLSFDDLELLIKKPEVLVISVDSFLPHFCKLIGKKCVVIWGKSDPLIFGYPENINILKDRKYLRDKHQQWVFWENETFNADAFLPATEVMRKLEGVL